MVRLVGEHLVSRGEIASQCFDFLAVPEEPDLAGRDLAVQAGVLTARRVPVTQAGKPSQGRICRADPRGSGGLSDVTGVFQSRR